MPELTLEEARHRLNFLHTHVNHAQSAVRMAMNDSFSAKTRRSALAMLTGILNDMDRELLMPERDYEDMAELEADGAFLQKAFSLPE